MNISLYQSVFKNVYLSTKIFATVHQIQRYHNSLRYDDIVDIGWMYDNKHISLLREKIKRKIQLHVDRHDLFLKVASTHTDIFIQLFESNRYSLLVHVSDFIDNIKNIEVLKYLVEKGHGAEKKINNFEDLCIFYTPVLEYLLEKGWCRPTVSSLLSGGDIDNYYSHSPAKVKEIKRKIQLVMKYIQLPITIEQSESILNHLLENPTPFVFDSIEPLLDPAVKNIVFYLKEKMGIGSSYQQAVDEIKRKESEIFSNRPNISRPPVEFGDLDAWVGKEEQEFINTWNRLEGRFRIINGRIYFTNNIEQVTGNENGNLIGINAYVFYIVSQVCKSLQLVHFIVSKGFNGFGDIKSSIKQKICHSTLRHHYQDISPQDRDLIQRMANNDFKFTCWVLTNCQRVGYKENFPLFFSLFTQGLDDRKMKVMVWNLFEHAAGERDVFLYESLEGIGYQFSMFNNDSTYHYEFKSMLPHFGKMIDSFPQEQKDQRCFQMLVSFMDSNTNNYFGFKYLFTKHKFSTLMDTTVIQAFADCNNLAFIDYLWMNRSTCFIETSSPADINTFFTTLFNRASTNRNIALLEYLVKNNCFDTTDTENITQEPYFSCKEPIDPKYNLDILVHFIDHRFFDSFDPYIIFLNSSSVCCSTQLVEYICRNQDKFNTEISFQSIYNQWPG
ncbi:hypothetical protein CYY_009847 [Polysphondylium violaceum]|uniref:Uncharacterized protein n=1 Tax=Polysphondylium violaceum TaxID=133409 RepID=A0A8J4PSV2_9MYCE|nr:hypothetical protein CYY_009847 [Polysphondylium violaceum]